MKDYAPLIERAFSFVPSEQSYGLEDVVGRVPEFVRGTYYLNGPARFSRAGMHYRHWLDGDGMVCALRFESGSVHFTSRFVRSAKFVAEEEAGRPLFRTFGTSFASDQLKRRIALESPVNVSVYPYDQFLLAFGEQGLPWKLDPLTLETLGEFNFGGCLNDVSPFAAHPKFDPARGEMFNFGIAFSDSAPRLHFYRFDARAKLLYRQRHPLDYACSVHDFSLSQNYAIFYLSPYLLNMKALARDGRTLMDSLSWEPKCGSRLLILSRETGEEIVSIPQKARHCLHLINCFEADKLLMVDVLELDRPIYDQYQIVPDLFTDVCEGQPVRLVVDVAQGAIVERREINYRLAPDFPSIDPRHRAQPYDDFWMLGISATGQRGRKFFDQLAHANWTCAQACDVYQASAGRYLAGEPVFIPDPECETAGVVICQVFDAESISSAFGIFDAFKVAAGPIAMLRLNAPMHLGFHGAFNPESKTE